MIFNTHSRLTGQHAFLSASSYHWINYDSAKLIERLRKADAARRGTQMHDLAAQMIRLGVKANPKPATTMSMYVNDAIGYMMTPEQLLYVNEDCFGTCDAISFARGKLRIHDLKTGETQAHFEQLMVYAAMFCMEYDMKPFDIEMELRIYQLNERIPLDPDPAEILKIMDTITAHSRVIQKKRQEGLA